MLASCLEPVGGYGLDAVFCLFVCLFVLPRRGGEDACFETISMNAVLSAVHAITTVASADVPNSWQKHKNVTRFAMATAAAVERARFGAMELGSARWRTLVGKATGGCELSPAPRGAEASSVSPQAEVHGIHAETQLINAEN